MTDSQVIYERYAQDVYRFALYMCGDQTLAEDRAAILMRAQHGMPYEEIARVLNISVAAVKIKIYRSRLKLATAREYGSPSTASPM